MGRARTGLLAAATTLALAFPSPAAVAEEVTQASGTSERAELVVATAPVGVVSLAHRGASASAPEHTRSALAQAVAARADRVSVDVQLTRDGVPIVLHDESLARTTDVEQRFPTARPYRPQDLTLVQIRTLDAGSWFVGGHYTGSRVLTLDEVLAELSASPVGVMVEPKPEGTATARGVGAAVMAVVRRHPEFAPTPGDPTPRFFVESMPHPTQGWRFLDDMHALHPSLPLVLLGREVTPDDVSGHPFAREIDVRHNFLTDGLVDRAHGLGMRVGVWSLGDRASIEHFLDEGVDNIVSSDPELLGEILTERGATWSGTPWPAEAPVAEVTLRAAGTVRIGRRVTVTALPRDATGTPLPWRSVRFQTHVDGSWRNASADATDSSGTASTSLPVTDGLRVRAVAESATTPTYTPVVTVAAPGLPGSAPRPSYRPAAQPRVAVAGARPRIAAVSDAVWRQMVGRSWRSACPVGRSGLRVVEASYWGYDGQRHRGAVTVARGTAQQVGRALMSLYDRRVPIRGLRRVESMGSWDSSVSRSVRSGSSFGFTCRRTPGDRAGFGSHARGTVLTLNAWENPTRVGRSGVPNSWWLGHRVPAPYVHRYGSVVVRAFAHHGLAWAGGAGRLGEFRDVR